MADGSQFPTDWEPDALGKRVGGGFVRGKHKTAPADLTEVIATDQHTKTATVTAAARPKPITPKPRRRR